MDEMTQACATNVIYTTSAPFDLDWTLVL